MAFNKNRELVKFISYEQYYGGQIFPICFKMNLIGLASAYAFGILNFFYYGISGVSTSLMVCFSIASVFILMMALASKAGFIPDCKRVLLMIIFGNASVVIFAFADIFVILRSDHLVLTIVFFIYGVIIVAPLLELKVFLISNVIFNASICSLLIAAHADQNEFIKIMSSSLISAAFASFIIKYLKKSFVKLYETAKQNFLFSNLDMLSQLLNRRSWYEASETCRNAASKNDEKIAFIMIDVDHFKNINDTYGHSCGDMVIKEISNVLVENTRENDIVGRLGGEEFGILVRNTTMEEAGNIAERIRKSIESLRITFDRNDINVTASLGLTFSLEENFDNFMKHGDNCLYQAKNSGRNNVFIG
jgi:diguanylate cyclase